MSSTSIQNFVQKHALAIGLISLAFITFILCITLNKNTTYENLIIESRDIVENLAELGSSLQVYADEYVTTRQGYETTVKGYVDSANTILTNVKVFQTEAKNSYNNSIVSLSQSETAVANGQTYLTNTTNALTLLQNIVNGVTPNSETAGSDFGTNLQQILNVQADVNNNYTDCKQFLDIVAANYTQAGQQEQGISDNLKNGNDQLNLLTSYITDLMAGIKSSPQYSNLEKSIAKAEILKTQLSAIISNVTDVTIKNKLEAALLNVNNAITTANNYKNNILTLFTSATTDVGVTITGYINQIFTIFANVVAIVGTITFQSPYPFNVPITLPPLPSGDNSLLFYNNGVQQIYSDIVTQYNIYTGIYNNVINNVNSVQSLVNTTVSAMGTTINDAITGFNSAQDILKPYLDGTVTTFGPYTMPTEVSPLSTMPTVSPYTFTTITPNLGS